MNKKDILFITFCSIVILSSIAYIATAEVLQPGGKIFIDCEENNGTFNISCAGNCQQQQCPDCVQNYSTCVIDKDVKPGELFEKQEGGCDVELYCEECNDDCETQLRTYSVEIFTQKDHGECSIDLELTKKDFLGTILQTKRYSPFSINDSIEAKYLFEMECPTEVVIEGVNFANCRHYFSEWMGDESPLLYQLSQQTTTCLDELMTAKAAEEIAQTEKTEWKTKWEKELIIRDESVAERERLNNTINTLRGAYRKQYAGYVGGEWLWIAGISILINIIVAFLFAIDFGGD